MTNRQLLKALRPFHDEDRNKMEPFEEYKERIGHLLPNWPECPLREWLHRHYSDAERDYGWLRFDTMTYERMTWGKDKIYNEVQTPKLKMLEGQGLQILTNPPSRRSTLQRLIMAERTWPAPIIILGNFAALVAPYGMPLGQPYHLLEGHLRLGYFRNLYRQSPDSIQDWHDVWLVRVPAKPETRRQRQAP